jgi:signal peptidase I
MEPSIKKGEIIILTPIDKPARWDVVSFKSPFNGNMWVQRVAGLPGEIIDIHDSSLYINGVKQTVPSKMKGIWYSKEGTVAFPFTIPKDSYFVLGDNTTDAQDSRYMGPIPAESIVSKVENK